MLDPEKGGGGGGREDSRVIKIGKLRKIFPTLKKCLGHFRTPSQYIVSFTYLEAQLSCMCYVCEHYHSIKRQ